MYSAKGNGFHHKKRIKGMVSAKQNSIYKRELHLLKGMASTKRNGFSTKRNRFILKERHLLREMVPTETNGFI